MALSPTIRLRDLRGGMNNTDEPQSLPDNQVVHSENIDWMLGTIGGKRPGCEAINIEVSVVNTVVPALADSTTGSVAGASSLTIAQPAVATDGTGTTYTHMLVYIATKNTAQNVTAVTYGGVALTQAAESAGTGASGRLECWRLANPSLAGGNVVITFAGSCDATACVQFYQRVGANHGTAASTGTSTRAAISVGTNPIEITSDALSYDTGPTATVGFAQGEISNVSGGQARLATSYELAQASQTLMDWTLSGSVAWVIMATRLQGAALSAFPLVNRTAVLARHTPTSNLSEDELWVVTVNGQLDRREGGSWNITGVPPVNQYARISSFGGLDVNMTSLHGKLFIAAPQSVNALLVWDGTVLRWAGFPFGPTPPTGADDGGVGTFTGTRYYRTRFVAHDASGNVLRRSEPSTVLTHVPGGTDTGVVLTKGLSEYGGSTENFASYRCNGQTHWEVEASLDNVLFYRIATVAIATTTYTDTTAYTTGYAANTLSDAIGENVAPHMARFVTVDDDRLVLGGDRITAAQDSRVSWTPVTSAPGVGNDERVPQTTKNFVDLDGGDGGGLQGLIAGESGNIYALKWERLYKLVRTGNLASAYAPYTESRSRGCTKLGTCSGQDAAGNPCIYFTDPSVGLCRIGRNGVETLGAAVQDSWNTVDLSHPSTSFGPRSIYWPQKHQVWTMVGFGATRVVMVYSVKLGGYSLYTSALIDYTAEGNPLLFPEDGEVLEPVLPFQSAPVLAKFAADATNDAGTYFRAYWRSRAYQVGELFTKFGVKAAALFAAASEATIGVGIIRNLGVATRNATVNIEAAGSETHVFKPIDNAYMSECHAVQFEVGDPSTYTGSQLGQTWSLNELSFKVSPEDEATS